MTDSSFALHRLRFLFIGKRCHIRNRRVVNGLTTLMQRVLGSRYLGTGSAIENGPILQLVHIMR